MLISAASGRLDVMYTLRHTVLAQYSCNYTPPSIQSHQRTYNDHQPSGATGWSKLTVTKNIDFPGSCNGKTYH